MFFFSLNMETRYLTYRDLVDRIQLLCMKNYQYKYNPSILFSTYKIIIFDTHNGWEDNISHNLLTMTPTYISDKTLKHLTISKKKCNISRGGYAGFRRGRSCRIPQQFTSYDIIDFWEYSKLQEHPEIINQILISRISYSGKPSETDKFQRFWKGDVKFLYHSF